MTPTWARIPYWVLTCSTLTRTDLVIYEHLARTQRDGVAIASTNDLVAVAGITRAATVTATGRLVSAGALRVTHRLGPTGAFLANAFEVAGVEPFE